jgi:hypothetical protein
MTYSMSKGGGLDEYLIKLINDRTQERNIDIGGVKSAAYTTIWIFPCPIIRTMWDFD